MNKKRFKTVDLLTTLLVLIVLHYGITENSRRRETRTVRLIGRKKWLLRVRLNTNVSHKQPRQLQNQNKRLVLGWRMVHLVLYSFLRLTVDLEGSLMENRSYARRL